MILRIAYVVLIALLYVSSTATFLLTPQRAEAGNVKVQICHIPPGNPDNFHTITVGENALPAHLAHGDLGGSCDAQCETLCGDSDACTIDACDPAGGCAPPAPVDCSDSDPCTTDSCDPGAGCGNVPVTCDAPDACTLSTCAPDTGECVDSPVVCGIDQECNLATGMCEDTGGGPMADLLVDKADAADPVVAGDSLTYVITVTNVGPETAENVVVTDTLPAGVTFVASTGCLEDPNGAPTCSLGNVVWGASAVVTIDVTVDSGTSGTITNMVSADSPTLDPNSANNSASEDTTVLQPNADLSIDKVDDADPVLAGNSLTYAITVTNSGPETAENVVVTDTLPTGVTFVTTTGCLEDPNGAPTCSLGNIPAGVSAVFTIEVTIDGGTSGTITNNASANSNTLDTNAANNSTSEDTTVISP